MYQDQKKIQLEFNKFIQQQNFPCIGAKAALAKSGSVTLVAGHMACPADDQMILDFIYEFTDRFRSDRSKLHSAAVLFSAPEQMSEQMFEKLMWERLQSLAKLDALQYDYDSRVSADPASPDFSFSLKEEAYYIIGMHPGSSREARRFAYPALVFNPHAQFETMKETSKYGSMQKVIRKRDLSFAGSINPMLKDHGESSEAMQYSGINYKGNFECPLKNRHVSN